MPWGLERYQQARDLHFVTFSCYRRQPLLAWRAPSDGSKSVRQAHHELVLIQFLALLVQNTYAPDCTVRGRGE